VTEKRVILFNVLAEIEGSERGKGKEEKAWRMKVRKKWSSIEFQIAFA
jgi:hypothetical protein